MITVPLLTKSPLCSAVLWVTTLSFFFIFLSVELPLEKVSLQKKIKRIPLDTK